MMDLFNSKRERERERERLVYNCAFTLAEVLMAKRVSDKTCSQEFVRMSEPKAPTNIFNKLCAFTLAEVLITLAIIGVVAALTIPAVVKNYKAQVMQTKFKKAHSVLTQALNQMHVDEGNIYYNYNRADNGMAKFKTFYKNYMKYFKVKKDCGLNNCVARASDLYKNYSNTGVFGEGNYYMAYGQFYTIDGYFIAAYSHDMISQTPIRIFVDTNGPENPPNRAGFDLFVFEFLKDDNLVPFGSENSTWSVQWNCNMEGSLNNTSNGISCATRALKEPDYFRNLPR